MPIITADKYNSTPVYSLLEAAATGHAGIDQRLLRSIVDRAEEALGDLVRFGTEERFADRISLDDDLIAIAQYLAHPKALPYLIHLLRQEPEDPAEDLVHALLRIGAPAIPALLDLYRELGPDLGSDIAFVLASFHERDPRILELLASRVNHDPADAAFLLGVHGDPAARPLLERMKAQAAISESFAQRLGGEADESLALLEQPGEPDPVEAVSLWDIYPEYIEPVFEVMTLEEKLEFLRSSSAEYRADCATSFIDREIPEVVGEILIGLAEKDPNVGVRSVACTALGGLVEDPRVLDLLLAKLADRSKPSPERCGALLGVASKVKVRPEVKAYIDEFYANPGTQARAVEAMWRSLSDEYAPVFKRHIEDPDYDVRRQAIKGVAFLQMSSEAPRILDLLQDEEFRLDALFAYAMCVPLKRLQRGDMPQLLKKIEELAGGLSDSESEVVETALDTRLMLNGLEPVFLDQGEDEDA